MTTGYPLAAMLLVGGLFCGVAQAEDVDIVSGASPVYDSGSFEHFTTDGSKFTQFADELGLTGQQRTDIQIIIADYMPRYHDLGQLGRTTANELLNMAPDAPGYVEATQKASATAASSAAELVTLLSEMRAKLYAVLTVEQRAKLQELIDSHHEHAGADAPES
jgi:Spy/CpxP family protein refolding chaperone